MYHLELRKFPKRVHRFNMTGQDVGTILLPWAQERVVELGEQKWNPQEAEITVLDGPEIPPSDISMGRGWRTAERESRDVTEQVLGEARAHVQSARAPQAALPDESLALAMQLGSLLGPDAQRLMEAWREARLREPSLSPSAALAAAERELQGG